MLTDEQLELCKICHLPLDVAYRWLFVLMPKKKIGDLTDYIEEGEFWSINQRCSLGGDTDELYIYHHSDDEYYLVQTLVGSDNG